jgi:hypothetical protein
MLKPWMLSTAALLASPPGRVAVLIVRYLAILVALVAIYSRADVRAPDFVYQGF